MNTEKSKDKTDIAGSSCNILLSLLKLIKKKRKQNNLDKKAGDTNICRRNKNASNKTDLFDAVDGTKFKDF